jgi:hypothetical protein
MILKAFPEVNRDGEVTEENIQDISVKVMAVSNDYLKTPMTGPNIWAFYNSAVYSFFKRWTYSHLTVRLSFLMET